MRREAEEADPHERRAAHDDRDQDEQEVEVEDASTSSSPKTTRPVHSSHSCRVRSTSWRCSRRTWTL